MLAPQYLHLVFSLTQLANLLTDSSQVLNDGLSFIEMLRKMGWPARAVAMLLALMSIYSIAVMFERWLTYNAARNHSREFAPKAARALGGRHLREALAITEQYKKSHLAIVVNAGLQEYAIQKAECDNQSEALEAVRDAVDRARTIKSTELRRGLSGLATIGSTAPFVGLLGTVIGIIDAFQGMKLSEGTEISVVAGGISEALVETAFGLIVAIPAVWAFNYFNNQLQAFQVEMNNSSSELVIFLKKTARTNLDESAPLQSGTPPALAG